MGWGDVGVWAVKNSKLLIEIPAEQTVAVSNHKEFFVVLSGWQHFPSGCRVASGTYETVSKRQDRHGPEKGKIGGL